MANDIQQKLKYWKPGPTIIAWWALALATLLAITPFGIGLIVAFTFESGDVTWALKSIIWNSFRFTILQAGISTAIVVIVSPLLGMLLLYSSPSYQRYSSIVRTLLFCLPSAVVATGIILCWGKHGIGSQLLISLGLSGSVQDWLYSNYTIILANVLMNLPFGSLIIYRAITDIDSRRIKSVKLIGLKPFMIIRSLIWPAIRPQLYYFGGLNFLLSMSNFGALRILSGNSTVNTLEMSIYQSLYLNADWRAAGVFAICHTACAATISLFFLGPQFLGVKYHLNRAEPSSPDAGSLKIFFPKSKVLILGSILITVIFDLIIATPIIAILADAIADFDRLIAPQSELRSSILDSLLQSLNYAIPSALLSTSLAWCLARAYCHYGQLIKPKKATLILIGIFSLNFVPSMANAFGFLALRSWIPNFAWDTWPIVIMHALLALPFLTMMALQIYRTELASFLHLSQIAGLPLMKWVINVEWPLMKNKIMLMFVIALALSMNETAIVTMLGAPESPTLTTATIRLMGHYRFGDSAVVSSVLILVTTIALSTRTNFRSPNHGIH